MRPHEADLGAERRVAGDAGHQRLPPTSTILVQFYQVGLNIKDPETEQLAAEIATLTGESKTGAIRTALRERKQRLGLAGAAPNREQALRELAEELWSELPPELRGHAPSRDEQDGILGYGTSGA